jgi:hypothetical protein
MVVCGLCADARGDRFPSVVPLANLGFVFDQLGFLLGEIGLQLVKLDFPLRVVPRRTRRRCGRRSRDRFAAPSIRTGSSPSKTAGIGCLLSNRTRSDIPAARLVPSAPPRDETTATEFQRRLQLGHAYEIGSWRNRRCGAAG